ncbi:histone deacetylase family protein [Alteromonas sediminis]|uniref:Histone deacetylase family protein n=1 Tax=Alteromonas sediminis TaxID=2259342 RepID=A0A3N5Z7J6_9ALTE|nr:histone deacetylase family protein [Alteromonas sediminis]RPJ66654.1 histone deacetylase family protein [Alteromonas sediminis]
MQITIFGSPKCALHNMDPEHPECPQRLHQINDQFISSGLEYILQFQDAKPVQKRILQLAHDSDYVETIFAKAPKDKDERVWLDDDTIMMHHTLSAALHAAGAAKEGIDKVLEKDNQVAFCAVRPPGHHAGKDSASGFCIFNNVAVAARYALTQTGIDRVAIVDFDVHHGNGTQDIVEGDDRILFCSSFQHPFYPYTGEGPTADNVKNIPVPAGTKGDAYRELVAPWFEQMTAFKPDLILVSAGFDAHAEESLGHLRLVEDDYRWLAMQIKTVADQHAKGRIVAVLEGGYALSALSRSVVAFLKGILEAN